MKKLGFVAILAVALVFGLAFSGCKSDVEDSPLNGTWTYGSSKYVFNNGKYIFSWSNVENHKGKYTADGSTLKLEGTDVYFNSEWKTVSQFIAIITESMETQGATQAQIDSTIEHELGILNAAYAYTLNGNTLIFDGNTYTRQ